ncbi:hypothetical protein ONK27_28315 [Salmonella enterica subsp. enterica serovar Virginia]|nr:hypothetical protein [Salmonella enterica subsp. enterica serovar Virginia]
MRYYEKQQMMDHEVRTEGGFRLYTENDLHREDKVGMAFG